MTRDSSTFHWRTFLSAESRKDYFPSLTQFVREERLKDTVYPPEGQVFAAFQYTPFDEVKVIILGQDPYHGAGQAHGLAFSVPHGVKTPPSLRNIYKELQTDTRVIPPNHGCLEGWAKQGVLLLNTTLTVRAGEPGSHYGRGWEALTSAAIQALNEQERPLVFILWGRHAQSKAALLDSLKHTVIQSAHPSPMSAHNGFFGSKPFSRANEALAQSGQEPIKWASL